MFSNDVLLTLRLAISGHPYSSAKKQMTDYCDLFLCGRIRIFFSRKGVSFRRHYFLLVQVFHSGDIPTNVMNAKRQVQNSKKSNVLGTYVQVQCLAKGIL